MGGPERLGPVAHRVVVKLAKADARRALVRQHFAPCATQMEAFERLRCVQFDPIAPVGCNHDLVLQARVPGYKIGDWEKTAYKDRLIYDGWDKQACLVPMEGWPLRRIIHTIHAPKFRGMLDEYAEGAAAILKNLEDRGPLMPKDCDFQERRAEWKSHWYSPNVTKRLFRALWHTGTVMTAGRKSGQHLYDLTERIVPARLYAQPAPEDLEARRRLMLERHRSVGLIRPSASAEMWSYQILYYVRRDLIKQLLETDEILPVDVDGIGANVTREFLALLDLPPMEPRVVFVAPLDQIMWDRKLLQLLFDFEYAWEIYVPEAKRKWGYYVLPVLFGDRFVAKAEFWCRNRVLEIRNWHWEPGEVPAGFWPEFERALRAFMDYCSATGVQAGPGIDEKVRKIAASSY